jgi:hypothetical protein
MAAVIVRLDAAAVTHMMKGPGGAVMIDLERRAQRVLNTARTLCPVDQGTLRGSLHKEPVTVDGDPAYRIGSPLEYAIYVHEGTGIYGSGAPIRPTSGKFLRWPAKNQSGSGRRRYKAGATEKWIFARQSSGSPGRPFLLQALQSGG